MKNATLVAILFMSFLMALSGCNTKEQDDLSKAQDCLDHINEAASIEALSCLQYTTNYTSQRADILKCSIYLTAGGLVTSRMTAAYKASKDSTITNKEASYMAFLALDQPDAAGGY